MKERQLSELMQEIRSLVEQKARLIKEIELSTTVGQWLHIAVCAESILKVEALLEIKDKQSKALILEIDQDREKEILEIIS